MKTAVITTINPNHRIEHQISCFLQWQNIGYDIYSFNPISERNQLLNHGIGSQHLKYIHEKDTAIKLFKKPIPRISPVLKQALISGHDYYILTNSDIYPAHRKVVSHCLRDLSQAIAFTRSECFDITFSKFHHNLYYRGGIDLFWFTRDALATIIEKLSNIAVAKRMTFGIPGWDIFLGHILLKCLNFPILDGGIFLHSVHRTTYNQIEEFEFYTEEMKKTDLYKSQDAISLAKEFSRFITQRCEDNHQISKSIKLSFFANNDKKISKNRINLPEVKEITNQFLDHLKALNVQPSYSFLEIEALVEKQVSEPGWASASFLIANHENKNAFKFNFLQILLMMLRLNTHRNDSTISLNYPKENLHAQAVKQIFENETGIDRDPYLFNLFASELIDHRILNKNLLKYIYTSCLNQVERKIFPSIITLIKKRNFSC